MFVTSLLFVNLPWILGVVSATPVDKSSPRETCSTLDCIRSASTVLKYMDQTADPCVDFYQFACGGFMKNTDMPKGSFRINPLDIVFNEVEEQLKEIIDEPNESSKLLSMIKKSYNLCMNTTDYEANGLNALQHILKDLGGWPLLEGENWNVEPLEWKNLMYKLRKIGFPTNHFIGFELDVDQKNSSKLIITIKEPFLPLSKSLLLNGFRDPSVRRYHQYVVSIAVLFGTEEDFAKKEIQKTVEFAMALAKIISAKEKPQHVVSYNPMTIRELQLNFPFIPWLEYITNLVNLPDAAITEDEIVNVVSPQFLPKVAPLLRQTPKRVLANYVIESVVRDFVSYLSKPFRLREERYLQSVHAPRPFKPTWKSCMFKAKSIAPHAMAAAYIRKYFNNKDSKQQAVEMAENIRKVFCNMLGNSTWMDSKTRARALMKAFLMNIYVGYTDELLDEEAVDRIYSNLQIDYSNNVKIQLSLLRFYADEYYKSLRQLLGKTPWTSRSFPSTVKSTHSFTDNSINIPAGILQNIFFGTNRPRYMNYGAIGSVIGHEIAHGFDDRGKDYDKDGNLEKWWEEETEKQFAEKVQCVIDEYGKFVDPEVNLTVDGNRTKNENVADMGGIKAAYLAYQAWVDDNGPESRLPGLDFTPNQMFWIAAANTNCAILRKYMTVNTHSPNRFRVLGPFSNSEFFSGDFKCPLGSPMNPLKKCGIW